MTDIFKTHSGWEGCSFSILDETYVLRIKTFRDDRKRLITMASRHHKRIMGISMYEPAIGYCHVIVISDGVHVTEKVVREQHSLGVAKREAVIRHMIDTLPMLDEISKISLLITKQPEWWQQNHEQNPKALSNWFFKAICVNYTESAYDALKLFISLVDSGKLAWAALPDDCGRDELLRTARHSAEYSFGLLFQQDRQAA